MNIERRVKIQSFDKIDSALLKISDNHVDFIYKDLSIEFAGKFPYPFILIQELREMLEDKHIDLLINASRKDVYVRGLMALGYEAYTIKLNDNNLTNKVNIFDELTQLDLLGSVKEQKLFIEVWKNSLNIRP